MVTCASYAWQVPTATIELAPGLWRIPTLPGDIVNSFAVAEADGSVTIIDTGTPFAHHRIRRGLAMIGRHPGDVRRIVLTHSHYDHAGSAARIVDATGARVLVHAEDAGYVRRGRPPSPAGGRVLVRLLGLPLAQRFSPVEVDEELSDGQVLPIGGGMRVIHTPGHTPGHVALLHEDSGVLITGDTLMNVGGIRSIPAVVAHDFPLYRRTIHVLGELDYTVAAFTHGPEIRDRARETVRRWLSRHAKGSVIDR